jgi:hypothetical protein
MSDFNTNLQADSGSYVQQTPIFDVTQIYSTEVNSVEFKELIVRLAIALNNVSMVLNTKDSGFHLLTEFNTSSLLFNNNIPTITTNPQQNLRNIYRIAYNVGALAIGVTSVAHNLNLDGNWRFLELYGMANSVPGGVFTAAYPINSSFITAIINGANIVINNLTAINFDSCYIVLRYVKF